MDVDVGSLLAGLGIGGLAFALAAKDTLANLFGSLTIFTDRPFQIGDYVVVAGVEGSIEEVGFRSTRVRTGADSVVTIPNSAIANSTIDNLGRRRCRRYRTQLGLTYDASPDQIEAFVEGIRASILSSPFTQKHRFDVGLHSFGPSELNIFVNLYFDVAGFSDELKGRHHIHLEWLRLAKRLGVGFAFPTQTLHLDTMGPQGRAPQPAAPSSYADVVRSFGPGGSGGTPETPAFTAEFWPEVKEEEAGA
jgi:MscS family membrane protein